MRGLSKSEEKIILALAGNPKNSYIAPLASIPNSYRIMQRSYYYDPARGRGFDNKLAIGVVIDGQYLNIEEYHAKYTRRGKLRATIPTVPHQPMPEVNTNSLGEISQRLLGAVPILYKAAQNCGLVDHLNEVYGQEVAKEILSLAMHWIHDKDNSARRFPRFASIFALPFQGDLDDEKLSRLYSYLGRDKTAISRLFALRCSRLEPKACVSYDSTSIPTKASDIYYQKESMSKEGTIEPMMHFSLLVDQKTGMPLLYHLFTGTTPDSVTVIDLIKQIQELADDLELIFVFDRGYETANNLLTCYLNDKNALMAAKSIEQSFIQKVRDHYTDFWDASSIIPGTTIHGHSEQVELKYRGQSFQVWVHVFRDDNTSALEHLAFMKKLDDFEKSWSNGSVKERLKLEKDNLIRFYDYNSVNEKELRRNSGELNSYTENFGFFANISVKHMTTREALEHYTARDCIEKCFQSGKMNIRLDTVRAHHQDTMEGRFVVAFVCLTILAELKYQLSLERTFEDKRRKTIAPHSYSVTDILDITRGSTISYAHKTKEVWTSGVLKEVSRLAVACGMQENLYMQRPEYLTSMSDLR